MQPDGSFRRLEIAGLRFNIDSDEPVFFASDPAAEAFLDAASTDQPDFVCNVTVHGTGAPDVSGMRIVFAAGRAWSLREDRAGARYVVGGIPGDAGPRWVALLELQ